MRLKLLACLFFALGIFGAAQAQNWPEDPAKREKAQEQYVLCNDYTKQDNYDEAVKAYRWLARETPELHEGVYINGIKIYSGLAEKAEGEQQKAYADTLMMVYDKRIELYGNEAKLRDRQAYDSYKYYKDHKDRYQKSMDLFAKTFEMNGNKVLANNLVAYMDMTRRYKKVNPDKMSDEQALDIYDNIMQVLEAQKSAAKARGKSVARYEKLEDQINKLLTYTVQVDCDFIANSLAPKLEANPNDLKMAKNIFKLASAGKCSDLPVYLDAMEVIQAQEPSFGLAKLIAIKQLTNKNYDESLRYFEQAVELAEEESDKGEAYLNMAKIYQQKGSKTSARNYAFKAVNADPAQRNEAYTLVGKLYMNSFEECKQGESPVKDRGVYLAAYEMFKKAGNTKMMKIAQEQFPSIEEIFTYNMQVGQKMTVGCWINEEVTIQKR